MNGIAGGSGNSDGDGGIVDSADRFSSIGSPFVERKCIVIKILKILDCISFF